MGAIFIMSLTPRFSAVENAREPQETVLTVSSVISANRKPLKRFPGCIVSNTRLKPGVNETT
jgi:hypothetical protein